MDRKRGTLWKAWRSRAMDNIPAVIADAFARLDNLLPAWLVGIIYLVVAAFLLVFVHAAALQILRFALRGRLAEFGRKLLNRIGPPTRLGVVVVGLGVLLQGLPYRGGVFRLIEWG